MKTVLIYCFVAAAAIVAYQAFSFLTRFIQTRSRDALWCLGFAGFSALYALTFIPFYTATGSEAATINQWGMLLGYITFAIYIKCMASYFVGRSRPLTYAFVAMLVFAGVYATLMVAGWISGHHFLVRERPVVLDIPGQMIPTYFANHYEMTRSTQIAHAASRLVTLLALIYLLAAGNLKRDRVIQCGVALSATILIHNMVAVNWAHAYFVPLIPFMNLIEITRLEWLARKGDNLRLEQYEEAVMSFEQGLNEHLKLKRIGQHAASFIHDAKNIAFASDCKLSLIEMAAQEARDDALAENINAARVNNQRLLDLLSAGREDYLKHNPHEPLDIPALVADAMAFTSYRLMSRGINVSITGHSQRTVRGDGVKLSQVIVNLVNNACDAVADRNERWITIAIHDTDDQTIISVTNSGEKIPPNLRDRIFDPFFSTKSESGGTGIGLKICRDNLEHMGGELRLNPDSPHTQFDIILP